MMNLLKLKGRRRRVIAFCVVSTVLFAFAGFVDTNSPDDWSSRRRHRELLATSDPVNCTPPAIEKFPRPLISPEARKQGALLIHLSVSIYVFFALAIVTDDYFVPSLEKISQALDLSSDVAGATFMAAGSSAPELATTFIAVFVAKDDIGVSGVIGSAVFNIMFVISVSALLAGAVVTLNWWPLTRDSFFYLISIFVLLLAIWDEEVTWYESLLLLVMYGLYCAIMMYNSSLESWAKKLNIPCNRGKMKTETESLMTKKTEEGGTSNVEGETKTDGSLKFSNEMVAWNDASAGDWDKVDPPDVTVVENLFSQSDESNGFIQLVEESPFHLPPQSSCFKKIQWAILLPLQAVFYFTIPDCRKPRFHRLYCVTFIMSFLWIGAFTFIMVWMITILGFTLGIPDTVMGYTFLAFGVSIPDALASVNVVKQGFGDMAVSNAVGSNVFDILICLGLPWFLQTAIISPGSTVTVISKGLVYSTATLLSTVTFLMLATHINGWKLTYTFGIILMIWYVLFMVLGSLYELNTFGYFNPPECSSDF